MMAGILGKGAGRLADEDIQLVDRFLNLRLVSRELCLIVQQLRLRLCGIELGGQPELRPVLRQAEGFLRALNNLLLLRRKCLSFPKLKISLGDLALQHDQRVIRSFFLSLC